MLVKTYITFLIEIYYQHKDLELESRNDLSE